MNPASIQHERSPLGRGTRYVLRRGFQPLSYAHAVELMAGDGSFRQELTALLAGSEFTAFRWETPPITRSRVERPFEFVLIDSPHLETAPEPDVFSRHFDTASPEVDVLAVPNLGRTATLIVPRQLSDPRTYAHLAAFVRGAPAAQVHRLWQCVARTIQTELSNTPLWVSTAGGGVSWLHVRIEGAPKYYSYRPYADDA